MNQSDLIEKPDVVAGQGDLWRSASLAVMIPCLNEEMTIGMVVRDFSCGPAGGANSCL